MSFTCRRQFIPPQKASAPWKEGNLSLAFCAGGRKVTPAYHRIGIYSGLASHYKKVKVLVKKASTCTFGVGTRSALLRIFPNLQKTDCTSRLRQNKVRLWENTEYWNILNGLSCHQMAMTKLVSFFNSHAHSHAITKPSKKVP